MLWLHGRGKAGPFIQCLHFSFGVGACLAPLVEVYFTGGTDSSRIRFAFWASAAAFVPVSLWILALPSPSRESAAAKSGSAKSAAPLTRREWAIALLAALLLALDVGAEIAYGGFSFLYGHVALGMPERAAAELTSLFWGALAVGRFLAIFVSLRWTPGRMLVVSLLGTFAASVAITFDFFSVPLLWAATFLYGLSQACVFPTVIALVESFMDLSGKTATVVVFGASLGELFVPLVLSELFRIQERTRNPEVLQYLVWILVLCAVSDLI